MHTLLNRRYKTALYDKQDITDFEACIAALNTSIQSANVLGLTSITSKAKKDDKPQA